MARRSAAGARHLRPTIRTISPGTRRVVRILSGMWAACVAIAIAAWGLAPSVDPPDESVAAPGTAQMLDTTPPEPTASLVAPSLDAWPASSPSARPRPTPTTTPQATPQPRPRLTTPPTSTSRPRAAAPSAPAPTSRTTAAAAPSSRGDRIVALARTYIGVPYLWGGEDRTGMDCSGLVYRVLATIGVDAPRTSAEQYGWTTRITAAAAQPGDLVFFYHPVSHVGIYVGGGRMIDASQPGTLISERDVGSGGMYGRVP